MFSFLKFFCGRKASAVENINQDQVTELIFETLPQVKTDPRWSFAVKRYLPVVLLLLLSLGCATTRPEMVDGMGLGEQLNAYIDDYYNQVAGLCIELHGKAQAGQSPVDCAIRDTQMHLSFPSRSYHDDPRFAEDIGRLHQHWCAAAGSKFGRQGIWVRHFRREKVVQSIPCRSKSGLVWPRNPNGPA